MIIDQIREKYSLLAPLLNERQKRLWAAVEAKTLGWGGIARVAEATGLSRARIERGVRDLDEIRAQGAGEDPARVRRPGAGRPLLEEVDGGLLVDLLALVDAECRGDPETPLLWTSKSARHLAHELQTQGHTVSHQKVAGMLRDAGYSLQANSKTLEGVEDHPDRDAQFRHIARKVREFQRQGQPVISVDTKKKELVGAYKNPGQEWHPEGHPVPVKDHDFPGKNQAKAIPFGIYDLQRNEGLVNVGTDHDTPAFAVASVRQWWRQMGQPRYPAARRLLVTADAGGSNAARSRLWKAELQKFADDTQLSISVCHFPPGTSKWNKIEHRMFCHISQNWRGKPLVTYETIVNLIANTKTEKGLRIQARLDPMGYPKGVKVSDQEMAGLRIKHSPFHGDWNHTLRPRNLDDRSTR